MSAALDALLDELCREINDTGSRVPLGRTLAWPDAVFLEWAWRIAVLQAELRPQLHRAPAPMRELANLPPTTTDTFRYAEVVASENPPALTFATSGTLAGIRGRHHLYRTDVYTVSALTGFDLLVPGARSLSRLISLVPPYDALPDSSLSWMLSALAAQRFAGRTTWAVSEAGIDSKAFTDAIAAYEDPVLIFTTTLAAGALLECDVRGALPPGSILLTTGGAKGRRSQVDAAAIEAELARRFPGATVGAEFGMTELLSQAYRVGSQPFRLPPWCRVLAVDSTTGARQPHGEPGLLRFVDLANVQSAVAVQTADRGITHSDQTFTLLGRALGAPLRGCSLTFEEVVRAPAGGP